MSIGLIFLDKFSFISKVRDSLTIYIHQKVIAMEHKITSYQSLIFLQKTTQKRLEYENSKLKTQIEEDALLIKQQNNQGINIKEVQTLKAKPNLYNNFKTTMARSIIDVNYLVNNKLLIDRGLDSQIAVGDIVLNKDGIVGQVVVVNQHNAQVTLVTNPDYKIYVQNSVSKSKMLAQGAANNSIMVKYINKNDKIKADDILVTTGLDDLYPANIPVAKVTRIFHENNGFNVALCEPIVDFNKLQYVLVLKDGSK